jgi:hypothetical protein
MPTDWTRLAKGRYVTIDGDELIVALADSRQHRVKIYDEGDLLRLRGIVATPSRIGDPDHETRRAWEHNRSDSLVGFRIDDRGRLVGECMVPVAGITADEFAFCVRAVAAECDRYEYLLTGRDVS